MMFKWMIGRQVGTIIKSSYQPVGTRNIVVKLGLFYLFQTNLYEKCKRQLTTLKGYGGIDIRVPKV